MSCLVTDIESVPLLASLDAPYPEDDRSPPANYKLPEAIDKWRILDRARWGQERAKECSLNPRLGRILCIGMGSDGDITTAYAETEADEFAMLVAFWDAIAAHNGNVVTWNGSWDLRFILIRSMFHGIMPTVPAHVVRDWFRRYVLFPHFDCKAALLNFEVKVSGEGLDEWARFFGLEGKTAGVTGADVWPMFQRGEHEAIREYCAGDVRATEHIYYRIAPSFTHQTQD